MALKVAAANVSTPSGAAGLTQAETLRALGFTDHEARVYLALTRVNPATAYEVAKVASLPRANVYATLRSLEAKGAIRPVTESPATYAPLDPEKFFGDLSKKTSALCMSLVKQVKQQSQTDENVYMWVARGPDAYRKLVELIENAREHVWIKAPAHLIEPVLPTIKAAARRKVGVKLIAFGSDLQKLAVHPRVQVFPHEGDGSSHGTAADVLLTMTVDFNGVMIISHGNEVIGSYASNHSIIYVVQTLLLHEIYLAEIWAALGTELESRFGKRLTKLRQKHRPMGMELPVLGGARWIS